MTTTSDTAIIDVSIPLARFQNENLAVTFDRQVGAKRQLGVGQGVLVADWRGPESHPDAVFIDHRQVAAEIERRLGTFFGALGTDPARGISELKLIRRAIDEGFIAVHAVSHTFGLAPDDRGWYSVYAS